MLTCPWHASRFRVSHGAVLNGLSPGPLKVYSNMIKEDFLFVEIKD